LKKAENPKPVEKIKTENLDISEDFTMEGLADEFKRTAGAPEHKWDFKPKDTNEPIPFDYKTFMKE